MNANNPKYAKWHLMSCWRRRGIAAFENINWLKMEARLK
jgi:hypothetical protein